MSKSPDDAEALRRTSRRVSLFWDVLIALASLACLIAAALFPLIANAEPVSPPPALRDRLARMVHEDGVSGVTVLVFLQGHMLYRADQGDIAHDAQLPVASASKWMAAALVMSV